MSAASSAASAASAAASAAWIMANNDSADTNTGGPWEPGGPEIDGFLIASAVIFIVGFGFLIGLALGWW